jgi:septum formation protein
MQSEAQKKSLLLASSSPYRKMLLERLGLPFEILVPAVDESPRPGETPARLVARLAAEKAEAIADRATAAVVIGSDQVAVHNGRVIGKPGTPAKARQQLLGFSGSRVDFLTAVSVRCADRGLRFDRTVTTEVRFRALSENEIARYVAQDHPVDCAGGFKSEAAGIALLQAMRSDDPTAIIGLPLISVAEALRAAGFDIP